MIGAKSAITSSRAVSALRRGGSRLREARVDDYQQIASLESQFDLAVKPYDEWVDLWQANPLYRELSTDWPIGWVLEDGDGKIVGSMGNIPLLYELDGRKILAASGRHWVAETAHRSASIVLLHSLITQRRIDFYVNTTVSSASVPLVTALGCSRAPVGVWDEVAYWITNYLGCFKSLISGKSSLALPSWEGALTHLKGMRVLLSKVSSVQFSTASLRKRLTRKAVREFDVEVRPCTDFDDRFDIFWQDLKINNPHVLLAVRSREFLHWHFNYALRGNRLWIATLVDGSRLIAYAIFLKTANTTTGVKQVKLVDYQSLDASPAMLGIFVSWALQRCRAEGIHILEHTGRFLADGEFFETVAPYRRKLPSWQYFYRINNPALKAALSDKHAWAPSLFDGDATL
jgi:hypothetical protein